MTTPVVLVHGWGGSFESTWQRSGFTELLRDAGRPVIGVDLLGHGSAPKPHDPEAYADLGARVLDAMPDEPVDAVGFSLGRDDAAAHRDGATSPLPQVGAGRRRPQPVRARRRRGTAHHRRTRGPRDADDNIRQLFANYGNSRATTWSRSRLSCVAPAGSPLTPELLAAATCPRSSSSATRTSPGRANRSPRPPPRDAEGAAQRRPLRDARVVRLHRRARSSSSTPSLHDRRLQVGTSIDRALEVLGNGGLVAIPTETVYGLAADAVQRRRGASDLRAKGRPADHPLIVHVAAAEQLPEWAATRPAGRWRCWPRPAGRGRSRCSCRKPRTSCRGHRRARHRRYPCAGAPDHHRTADPLRRRRWQRQSANRFGKVSPTTAQHVAPTSATDGRLHPRRRRLPRRVWRARSSTARSRPPQMLRPGRHHRRAGGGAAGRRAGPRLPAPAVPQG
jgi:tRNA A37 threonylcarbamoyladenosine synthetase subunit TsaC/SUA5/YrdC